jgi:succinyl-CoA synthetase beta subunit
MELHEFQGKVLLNRYGISRPAGAVAITADEAAAAADGHGPTPVVVKAQILAGDRFRAGGVRIAASAEAAKTIAEDLIGRRLVTEQTGPTGEIVKRVLVEKKVNIEREIYLSITVDELSGSPMLLGGAQGGDDIENRAASGESALVKLHLGTGDPANDDITQFCGQIGLTGRQAEKGTKIIQCMHRAFLENDAALIEINPLALTYDDDLIAVDVKIVIDDNALFRHPDLVALREAETFDEVELKAQRHQLNFYQMNGDIGVIVNGAGLALATLDMIHEAGGRPANFMDIRTTAKSLDIAQGVGLVLDNPQTKVLLVNVYGGGMQPCDTIIDGLGIAFRRKGRVLPIVLRMTGNNEDLASLRLANFNLPTVSFPDMWQAVTRAVAVAKGKT